jgi:hypothetical protein
MLYLENKRICLQMVLLIGEQVCRFFLNPPDYQPRIPYQHARVVLTDLTVNEEVFKQAAKVECKIIGMFPEALTERWLASYVAPSTACQLCKVHPMMRIS